MNTYEFQFEYDFIVITIPAENWDEAEQVLKMKLNIVESMGIEMPCHLDFVRLAVK